MKFLAFLLRRALWLVLTLWIVFSVSFMLMKAVPGGPFDREKDLPATIKRNIEARYDLDKPLWYQYSKQLLLAARWDFGHSYRLEDYSVNEIIAEGFPVSASLGLFAMSFALALGLFAGVISALRRSTWLDTATMGIATLGIAVPSFVLASLCVLVFSFWLHWLPAAGWGSPWQMILPSLCLGLPYAAYLARLTRTSMLEVLGQDYIRTAYAKGLPGRRVVIRHALRGALLPVVSFLGPATAGILTGSLVLERIFNLPGMGSHFIEAAFLRDYTLATGVIMTYTLLVFTMNTLVDLSYAIIDPRVKLE